MIYIPENTDKKVYPVAIAMVICLFFMVTILGLLRAIPETNKLSHDFNVYSPAPSLPTRITIPVLGLDSPIINPSTTDIDSLDNALLKGAVRYPGSAMLGQKGNMILFGHSSHLKFVKNKAYQTFNGIETLKVNDEIIVHSDSSIQFKYAVTKVTEVKETDGGAYTRSSITKLTLITCDNFGAKEDRYIVEAELVN